jgi:hypothetical protein
MNIKKKLDSIGLNFQEASKDEVISTIFQLKKLERQWFAHMALLVLFVFAQVFLILMGWIAFDIISISFCLLPIVEVYRIWPLARRINLYLYLYQLMSGDLIDKKTKSN